VIALIEEHKKVTGQSTINNYGYPDMGNGRYSEFLDYEQWLKFNNAQRAHYNMVESSGPALAMMLSVGLLQPKYAAILGAIYGTGRLLYGFGYAKSGADGRALGAAISGLAYFGLIGLALYYGAQFAGVLPEKPIAK
jgi:glutathione S-transferase